MDVSTDPAERLLRDLRPEPRKDFVRALEASLAADARRHERVRALVAGTAVAMSLAGLVLVLGVLGLLPAWTDTGEPSTEAKSPCRTEYVLRRERRPVLVVGADGTISTEQRTVTVERPVRRCP